MLPVITGVIDRRILVNFRIDPDVMSSQLPPPFRLKLAHGYGMAGICLIRLREIRPRHLPAAVGLRSENAAHRVAVRWNTEAGEEEGVYVPRRDTSLFANRLLGGRLFPGQQNGARFAVTETESAISLELQSLDGTTHVAVRGNIADRLPDSSIFGDLAEASEFFRAVAIGYSANREPDRFDGIELRTFNWHVTPLAVEHVESSFFADQSRFPPGSVTFDSALLMRGLVHEWRALDPICCTPAPAIRPAA